MSKYDSYDVHLYKRMLQAIGDYRNGNLGLSQLISNLEGLLGLIEKPEQEWTDQFFRHWMVLEEIFAVALDRNKKEFDEHDQSAIKQSLENLEEIIKSQLS